MKCSECPAECCRFSPIEKENLRKIAETINLTYDEFISIYKTRPLQKQEYCINVDMDTYRCKIYEDRPEVCRNYFCKEWEPE